MVNTEERYILLCILKDNIVTLKTGNFEEVSSYKDELDNITSAIGATIKIDKIDSDTELKVTNNMKYVKDKYSYLIT